MLKFATRAWLSLLLVTGAAAPGWAQETPPAPPDPHQNCDNFYENLARFAVPAPSRSVQSAPYSAYAELSEGNASAWGAFATGTNAAGSAASASVSDDISRTKVGSKSIKFVTSSGFDTGVTYPKTGDAHFNVSSQSFLSFYLYGVNTNQYGFQGEQPRVVLKCAGGSYTYTPKSQQTFIGEWAQVTIPLAGSSTWVRTQSGSPLLSDVLQVELHHDTWGYGFTLYIDGFGFYAYPNTPLPTPPPPAGVNANVIKPRVLLYCFDPIMENKGGVRQHSTYYGFQDPLKLTPQIVADLKRDSHDRVQYQIVDTKVVDAYPYFTDGFQHTDASFNTAWTSSPRVFYNGTFDYARFTRENNIAARIESGDLDEVRIYAGPISGTYESAMGGSGAYWINGSAPGVVSERTFVMMGWNFERGVGEAIHSYGHRAESILAHSYGPMAANQNNNFNKFTLQHRQVANLGGVGNVHFPFNAVSDYDYANTQSVPTNADDWATYPNFAGLTRTFNKNDWRPTNADPQRQYLNWWYNHLPHGGGVAPDGFLNNWWRYITDVDQFKRWDGNLNNTQDYPIVNISNPAPQSSVQGVVPIKADVAIDGAVGRVDFYVDGIYRATDDTAPYSYAWNTAGLSGSHQLEARAIELHYGREATSPTIEVFVASATAPQNVSVSPTVGTSLIGQARSFTALYRDANGAGDLRDCSLLVNTTSGVNGALFGTYNPLTNKVYLRNDDNTGWVNPSGDTPGAFPAQVVQNRQGVLNVQEMLVTRSGTDLTIIWSFSPKASFAANQNLYLSCTDASGAADALEDLGDWNIIPDAVSGLIISEFRFRGPSGSADEYVEIYNTLGTALNISGWSIQTNAGIDGSPIIQTSTVPKDTVIPARGHFLFTGDNYSLSSYAPGDFPIGADANDDSGVALFNAAGKVQDAVGFTSSEASLREGAGLPSAPIGNSQTAFMRDFTVSLPKDSGDSSKDFVFVSTDGASAVGTDGSLIPTLIPSQLGAPSPEGLASPVYVNNQVATLMLDPGVAQGANPNRVRIGSGDSGTLIIRRKIVNKSGRALNRVRFTVTRITSLGSATTFTNQADIRLVTSPDEAAVATSSGNVAVSGTMLESPSAESPGGALGSSVSYNAVLATPLAAGASGNYAFRFNIAKAGSFLVALNIEALPNP